MDYQTLRTLADSWGLLFMVISFAMLVAWAFRPAARGHHARARMIPFSDETVPDPESEQ